MRPKNEKTLFKLFTSLSLLILLLGFYLAMRVLGITSLTREEIQAFVAARGALAPLAFILISFLGTVLLPIPGAATILAGSVVFGSGASFLYSYIGMLSGAMLSFFLGRRLGKPFVDRLTGGEAETEKWIRKLNGKENVMLFFMFLFPAFPDDLLCAVAGILPISFRGFLLMQIVTRATSIGATLLFMSGEFIPFHGWGLAVLGGIGILGIIAFVLCLRNAKRLSDVFYSLILRITSSKLFSRRKK